MTQQEFQQAIVSISKEALASLPAASYSGRIVVIDKEEDVPAAIEELRKSDIIGFDTETRPSFRKGQQYKVGLIQLATPQCCYLFRTNKIGYPSQLIDLLEDPGLLKIGLSVHDDFLNLNKGVKVNPEGFIDLQTFVKDYKIADNSLSRLYGILFGRRISKGQRLSNWEASDLSEAQKMYAALDAFACINIYQYLVDGNFNPRESQYLKLISETENEN